MREAETFDSNTVAAGATSACDGDGTPSADGIVAAGCETTDATGQTRGHDLPTVLAPTSGQSTHDSTDPEAATLQADPSTLSVSSSPHAARFGFELERTVATVPSWGPSADPAEVTSDGLAPSVPGERPVPAIAGYEILGELGRGGMGVVYHAREVRLDRPCALKMILAGAHTDAVTAIRFMDEAKAIARLQHPNVVQIHHIGEADGLPYFELEYLDGGALDRRLNGTPWPARQAAALVEPLGRAVAEAHRLGIVHRDLKPANVLMAADGTPKVTDFGLVKWLAADSGLTATESILGSPSYMAPEQAGGRGKEVGPAADVYALGAILYELLVGRPPFRGASILETLEQVRHAEPVPPSRLVPGTPRDLETIVLKCLQKEPGRRYESAGVLAEDLRRFLAGEPIVARPIGVWERVVKWARRRPTAAATAATLLLATASLLAIGAWSYRSIGRARDLAEYRRREATAVAYRALLGETQALRLARTPGWHGTARENLFRLATMETPRRDLSDLRSEAVAGLAELGVREVARLDQGQSALISGLDLIFGLDFSPDGRTVIGAGYNGSRFLWDWAGDRVIATPAAATWQRPPATAASSSWASGGARRRSPSWRGAASRAASRSTAGVAFWP